MPCIFFILKRWKNYIKNEMCVIIYYINKFQSIMSKTTKIFDLQAHAINLTIAYDIPKEYVLDFVHFYTYLKSMCIVDDEIIVSKFLKRMLVAQITGRPVFNDEFKKMMCNEQ